MSSLDAVFLAVEDHRNPMNLGSVGIFDGPAPDIDKVREFVAHRIARAPRFRQRVHIPRGPLGRPVWIEDTGFEIGRHVFDLSLAGDPSRMLEDVVADVMPEVFDRRHPLWCIWLVDGLPKNQWAVIVKVHHCMLDGIAGNDLLCAILTDRADAGSAHSDSATPDVETSTSSIVLFDARTALRTLAVRVRNMARVIAHPSRSLARARVTLRAATSLWFGQEHRSTSLVGPIGSHRVWARTSISLKDIQSTAISLDCTVNDIVLTAVSLGLRQLLIDRGENVDRRTVTTMVPVSLRQTYERGQIGNRVANVHALLPVGTHDPMAALRAVHDHLDFLKASGQVHATGLLMRIGDYVPRIAANEIARAIFHRQKNVQFVITNVPGPMNPLHLDSHRMVEGYPIAPIGGLVRMSIAAWSYCDTLNLGLTADRESTPDLEKFAKFISTTFEQILALSD